MLNQVILIGRLVKKPELKESDKKVNYIKATLAVQSDFKNKDGNYDTEFFEFTTFGKTAENTAKYCEKGSLLNIVGSLNNNVYTDKNGVKHYQMSVSFFFKQRNEKRRKRVRRRICLRSIKINTNLDCINL